MMRVEETDQGPGKWSKYAVGGASPKACLARSSTGRRGNLPALLSGRTRTYYVRLGMVALRGGGEQQTRNDINDIKSTDLVLGGKR